MWTLTKPETGRFLHSSGCSQQQSSLRNQNKDSDQDNGTCKEPLLQSGSILTVLLVEVDYRGGNKEIRNHVYQENTLQLVVICFKTLGGMAAPQ